MMNEGTRYPVINGCTYSVDHSAIEALEQGWLPSRAREGVFYGVPWASLGTPVLRTGVTRPGGRGGG